MKRTRKKTTKQETLQQPTVAITMTAEDKAAAEKVAALREAEAAQKAREDAIEATYRKRFDRHFEELRWLYMELYGNSSMFAELCDNMKRFYMERNTDLRASDASREKRPDWYKQNDMMGMMFYIDNFAGNMKGRAEEAGLYRTVWRQLHSSDAVSGYSGGALRWWLCSIRLPQGTGKAWHNGGSGASDRSLP